MVLSTVYCIEFNKEGKDYYYIGSTSNFHQRINDHLKDSSKGSQWINKIFDADAKRNAIPKVLTGELSDTTHEETKFTLQYMVKHGIKYVRGGEYCRPFEYTQNEARMIGQAVIHHFGSHNNIDSVMRGLTRDMNNKIKNQHEDSCITTPSTKKAKSGHEFNSNEIYNKHINTSVNRLPFSEFKKTFEDYKSSLEISIPGIDTIVEFQEKEIDISQMKTYEQMTKTVDHIFNVEEMFTWNTNIDNMVLCEIPPNLNWEEAVKLTDHNVFLYTGYKEWIWLKDRQSYKIETNMSGESKERTVWMGEICTFDTVKKETCLNFNIRLNIQIGTEPPAYNPSASMPSEKLRIKTFYQFPITIHHVKKTGGPKAGQLMLRFDGPGLKARYSITTRNELWENIKKYIKCQQHDQNKLFNGMKFDYRDRKNTK